MSRKTKLADAMDRAARGQAGSHQTIDSRENTNGHFLSMVTAAGFTHLHSVVDIGGKQIRTYIAERLKARAKDIPGKIVLSTTTAASFAVRYGDVLFNRTSETQEEVGLASVYVDQEPVVFGGFVIRGRPIGNVVDPQYVGYGLRSPDVRTQIIARGQGGIRSNIGQADLRTVEVLLPPIEEQRAIATALGDVDALIGTLDKLIDKKRDLKQAAMQQLLTGHIRLPGFTGAWEVKRLGELLEYEQPTKYLVEDSEYSDANDVPVLTAGKTFVLGYTCEQHGIYRALPAIIFDDFTTATKYVTFPFKTKSSAMKILTARRPELSLRLVFELMQQIKFQLGDHKRYWISEYRHIEIRLPKKDEQTAIATVLSDMDAELAALQARRDKTRALKQGMMQELLTGRIRLV